MKKAISKRLDEFILDANSLFKEFLAAWIMHTIGSNNLKNIADDIAISPCVGFKQRLEPIPMVLIKRFCTGYPHFILEVYHGKLVQLANTLMDDLFCIHIDEHLKKSRPFVELKTQSVKIDFASTEDISTQLKLNCARVFTFNKYSERLKIINKALNPENASQDQLDIIKKHILVRNCIQHSNGVVDQIMIKELGTTEFELADEGGKAITYTKDDRIMLTIPEIHNFMSSLLFMVQQWRGST